MRVRDRATSRRDQNQGQPVASIGPASELGYVLSGHTDVVPADGQIWASDPFKLRLNVVPSHAEFLFEFRTLAEDDPDLLVSAIEQFAHDVLEPRMRCVDPLAGFEFETYADTPGLDTPEDADLVGLAKALAGRQHHQKVSFMTEGGLFQYIASIPTVVIGPGSINQAHKADEWVAIAELEQCSAFVQRLIAHCRR
jgi:acetylornithine deacetylase